MSTPSGGIMATAAHALLPPMSSYQSFSYQPSCECALRRDRPRRNKAPGASLDAANSRCSELDAANKLFRLCSEPRRLWCRYAYAVPGFALLAFGELLHRAIGSSGGRLLPEAGEAASGEERGTLNWDLKDSLRITERPPAKSPAMLLVQNCIAVPANATQGKTRGTCLGILRMLRTPWAAWQTHALALADQAVVSGTSFLTMVVVGRSTSASELGLYSIASSLLVTSVTIQDSLISFPYTIQRHRLLGKSADHSDSSLKLSFLLSALCIVVLALAALGLSSWNAEAKLVAMIWALAAVAPFALLRAFGRRLAF